VSYLTPELYPETLQGQPTLSGLKVTKKLKNFKKFLIAVVEKETK
jgi:hypothetical protein